MTLSGNIERAFFGHAAEDLLGQFGALKKQEEFVVWKNLLSLVGMQTLKALMPRLGAPQQGFSKPNCCVTLYFPELLWFLFSKWCSLNIQSLHPRSIKKFLPQSSHGVSVTCEDSIKISSAPALIGKLHTEI